MKISGKKKSAKKKTTAKKKKGARKPGQNGGIMKQARESDKVFVVPIAKTESRSLALPKEVVMSQTSAEVCAIKYGAILRDPFGDYGGGYCIPDGTMAESFKFSTMLTATGVTDANGNFVAFFDPWKMAAATDANFPDFVQQPGTLGTNNLTMGWWNAPLLCTGTTADSYTSGTGAQPPRIAPVDTCDRGPVVTGLGTNFVSVPSVSASPRCLFTRSQLVQGASIGQAGVVAQPWGIKLVAAGMRARYVGPVQTTSGIWTVGRDQGNRQPGAFQSTTVGNFGVMLAISPSDARNLRTGVGSQVSMGEVNVAYVPMGQDDFSVRPADAIFKQTNFLMGGGANITDIVGNYNVAMRGLSSRRCMFITGESLPPNAPVYLDCTAHFEMTGINAPMSPNPVDILDVRRITAATPATPGASGIGTLSAALFSAGVGMDALARVVKGLTYSGRELMNVMRAFGVVPAVTQRPFRREL